MFFGLCNSPATFQRVMNNLFASLLRTGCVIIYVDDILIFTPTLESHIPLVKQVLQTLLDNQLSLKPSKCDFHKDTVEYLGRLISKGAVTIKTIPHGHPSLSGRLPQPRSLYSVSSALPTILGNSFLITPLSLPPCLY